MLTMLSLLAPAWGETEPTQHQSPDMDMMAPMATAPETMIATGNPMLRPLDEMRFISLARITFKSNKWDLNESTKRQLDRASAYLMANPGAERLLLEAHTDWVGGATFNDNLSDKRAMAVQKYLESKGVDPRLISWKGHGEHAPVDENWTRLGRARNRHVELFAIYLPQR